MLRASGPGEGRRDGGGAGGGAGVAGRAGEESGRGQARVPEQLLLLLPPLPACPQPLGTDVHFFFLGTDPLWAGIGGDTAAVLLGLKLGSPVSLESLVDNAHMWEPSSNQPGRLEQM